MKILINPNYTKEIVPAVLKRVTEFFDRKHIDYDVTNEPDEDKYYDLLLFLGGDGTFLRSTHKALKFDCPIVGINCGSKGVLCQIPLDHIEEDLQKIIDGNLNYVNSDVLDVILPNEKKIVAINDLTVFSSNTIDHFIIRNQEGRIIYDSVASGLIISSAIGSTGITKSAGGSTMSKELPIFEITPICPNRGNDTSLIVTSNAAYSLSSNHDYQLAIDGKERIIIKKEEKLHVYKHSLPVKYVI